MSTRLTNDIRSSIATLVLRHRFEDEIEALVADRAAFAEEVYNDIYRKPDREKMAALPSGWLPEANRIGAQFGATGNTYVQLDFAGSVYGNVSKFRKIGDRNDVRRRLLTKHAHGCAKAYEDSHRLSVKHMELDARFGALKSSITTAERQTETALASVGTIKRLIEVWPEVAPFALKFEDAPRNLPTVPTSELNKLLDLPVAA